MNRMRNTAIALAVIFGALLSPPALTADELLDLEQKLTLLQTKLSVAETSMKIVVELRKLADAEKAVADERVKAANQNLLAAQTELAVAQKRLEQPVQLMRMLTGQVMVIRDHKLTCDAMPFLRWKCNGKGECDFDVGDAICGLPDAATDTVELKISYRCGDSTVDGIFWSGQKAYLTCR